MIFSRKGGLRTISLKALVLAHEGIVPIVNKVWSRILGLELFLYLLRLFVTRLWRCQTQIHRKQMHWRVSCIVLQVFARWQ